MKKLPISLLMFSAMALAGCAGNTDVKPTNSTAKPIQSTANTNTPIADDPKIIHVQRSSDFDHSSLIDQRGIQECHLNTELPEMLYKTAANESIQIIFDDKLNTNATGYNLSAKYTQIIDRGNPFTGHYKFTQIYMTLYKDGKKLASADFGRRSGGGFFGEFKGSCSVLGRTVQANVNDVVRWLKSPVDGAHFGNPS